MLTQERNAARRFASHSTKLMKNKEKGGKTPLVEECDHVWRWHATGAGMGHICDFCGEYRPHKEETRGGDREGAGRPPRKIARKAITIRVEPDIAEKFTRLCESKGKSQSEQFSEMVKRARI